MFNRLMLSLHRFTANSRYSNARQARQQAAHRQFRRSLGSSHAWVETLESRAMLATVEFQNFDAGLAPALPAGWVATSSSNAWRTSASTNSDSAPNIAFVSSAALLSDSALVSPVFVAPPGAQIQFRNLFVTQPSFDGGVFEISINGGAFADVTFVGGSFATGGYTTVLNPTTGNPLGARPAWSGGADMDTTVNLPASAFGQSVQVRWRLGTDTTIQDGSWVIDTIRLTSSSNFADFGDAPAPYPTTVGENGAAHIASGPRLGASRDVEANGTHSATANFDGADENGVTFGAIRVGALDATATVSVAAAPMGARLNAWIDFNGDGNWGGPGEQIAANVAVVNGNNTIRFDVPSFAQDGQAIARFRLSTGGNLGMNRLAMDGEVEDYAVTILRPAASSGTFSSQKIITTAAGGARSVTAADLDSDGDMDVLAALSQDNRIVWYENIGSGDFLARTISTAVASPESVVTADLDGDGDMDVLSASFDDNKIAWYENNGSQNFTARTISTNAISAGSVVAADMDGDGDLDVLSTSSSDNKIAWYENNGSEVFTARTISTNADGPFSVFAADVDRDGDLDVLSTSFDRGWIVLYENDGNTSSEFWNFRVIRTGAVGAITVFAADVDGDGDLDVLSTSANGEVAWYENDGFQNFTAHTISTTAVDSGSVLAADMDGDGDMDVLISWFSADKIVWYENNGSQVFTPRTISTAADGASSVFAADVDGDGDLDVLSSSLNDNKVAWYENVGPTNVAPVIGLFDTAISYTEKAVPVVLDSNATVTDSDSANLATGRLTVRLTSNAQPTDRLAIRHQGTGVGQIGVSGANVTFGGLVIGTFTGGTGAAQLVITFNGRATAPRVQALLRNVTFRTISENPVTAARTVRVTLTDGDGGTSIQRSKRINVIAVNDAPVITSFDTPVNYSAGSAAVLLDSNAVVTDADSANFAAGTLTVRLTSNAQATDRIAIRNQGVGAGQIGVSGINVTFGGVVIGTFAGGTGPTALVVTFNANATLTAVQSLMRNINYRNTSAAPSTLARTVQVSLTDGDGGTSNLPTKRINVLL